METASLSEIKQELKTLTALQLNEIIVKLARFKKENKELLSYLLFDTFNRPAYIQAVKDEIDGQFKNLHRNSPYLIKKAIRKVVKNTNKYIRFAGSKEIEVEIIIHLCRQIKKHIRLAASNRALASLYANLVKRAGKTLAALHEDLQLDYEEALKELKL